MIEIVFTETPCGICGGIREDWVHQETQFGGIDHEYEAEAGGSIKLGLSEARVLAQAIRQGTVAEARFFEDGQILPMTLVAGE